jgi:hypothetical protein
MKTLLQAALDLRAAQKTYLQSNVKNTAGQQIAIEDAIIELDHAIEREQHPLKPKVSLEGMSRVGQTILQAMVAIESAGEHPLLTEINQLLNKAGIKVVDLVDQSCAVQTVLRPEDFFSEVIPHLNERSQIALSRVVTTFETENHIVCHLGFRGSSTAIAEAGKKMADMLNEVCGAYQVVGMLGSPMKLNAVSGKSESLYVCYLAFTPESARVIEDMMDFGDTRFFREGDSPTEEL